MLVVNAKLVVESRKEVWHADCGRLDASESGVVPVGGT